MARILLVEDDPEVRQAYAESLKDVGYQVETAADGFTAIRLYQEHHPQLIILDILMPGKDGIETILELRKQLCDVPIIALSGGGCISAADCLNFASKCGADLVFTKPVPRQQLLDGIESLLAKHSLV